MIALTCSLPSPFRMQLVTPPVAKDVFAVTSIVTHELLYYKVVCAGYYVLLFSYGTECFFLYRKQAKTISQIIFRIPIKPTLYASCHTYSICMSDEERALAITFYNGTVRGMLCFGAMLCLQHFICTTVIQKHFKYGLSILHSKRL